MPTKIKSSFIANLFIRCRPQDVYDLEDMSKEYDIGRSALARVALRKGLDIIREQGLQIDPVEAPNKENP